MSIYYAIGDALVSEAELQEKERLERFDFSRPMIFSTGAFDPSTVAFESEDLIKFEPIGLGKPLIVEIRQLYTGAFPHRRREKDIMVTSAMKSIAAFNGEPRAINFLQTDVGAQSLLEHVPATDKGTPLIFYSPALPQYNSTITVEFGFDEFDEKDFDVIGNMFSKAAGVPIFAAASVYLLAAGAVTKIAGKIGSLLFDKKQVFKSTEPLYLLRGGTYQAKAGFVLLTDDRNDFDAATLERFKVNELGQFVDTDGNGYNGDTPYVIISYDGREMDEYKNFAPVQASAELLDRFYSVSDRRDVSSELLFDSLKLFNDFRFRQKADELDERIKKLDPAKDAPQIEKLTKERDAALKNIVEELLQRKG